MFLAKIARGRFSGEDLALKTALLSPQQIRHDFNGLNGLLALWRARKGQAPCVHVFARSLHTLWRKSESQVVCFHGGARSFVKTPGG